MNPVDIKKAIRELSQKENWNPDDMLLAAEVLADHASYLCGLDAKSGKQRSLSRRARIVAERAYSLARDIQDAREAAASSALLMIEKRPPSERYELTIRLHRADALIAQGHTIAAATRAEGVSVSTYAKHKQGIRPFSDLATAKRKCAEGYSPYGRELLGLDATP